MVAANNTRSSSKQDKEALSIPIAEGANVLSPEKSAKLEQAHCVDVYSVTRNRHAESGKKGARYLKKEALAGMVGKNLYHGFKHYEEQVEERQNTFWDWITTQASGKSQLKEKLHKADFVCGRGLLKRVAQLPYNRKSDLDHNWRKSDSNEYYWEFSAQRVADVIFLCESERYLLYSLPENEQREAYRGFKFGECVTAAGQNVTSKTDKSATNFAEFVAVMQSTLSPKDPKSGEPLKLLYNGEIDAISEEDSEEDFTRANFVELKVTSLFRKGDEVKRLQWFLHSYLMGIRDIYICYDENGVVKEIDRLFVEQLCEARKVDVCMNMLYKVLNEIKSMLKSAKACTVKHVRGSDSVTICPVNSVDIFSPKFKEQFEVE